jgi:hypothetical protein
MAIQHTDDLHDMALGEDAETMLADALAGMVRLHQAMMHQINHATSFYSADTLRQMNEAPAAALRALARVGVEP